MHRNLISILRSAALAATLVSTAQAVEVDLELLVEGLTSPIALVEAPDGSGRLFIVEQTGQVLVYADGALMPTPFLDVSDQMIDLDFFDEGGLLGMAFHPDYASNGRFFVRFSAPGGQDHVEVLAEFSVMQNEPNLADPSTQMNLLEVDEPDPGHNGGTIAFGPDGYLYLSLGDGGGQGDQLGNPDLPHGPLGNGQNVETLLGAVLRLDVDSAPDAGLDYAIPADNPLVGVAGRDEIYAYGFRNPFRFSFDDGPGGDGALYVADVGQNLFEEVDVVAAGGNYGWATREGLQCFDPFDFDTPPASCAETGPGGEPLLDPVLVYDHETTGISVIGGFVYRGGGVPALGGKYVFGDFSRAFFSGDGRLFYADVIGDDAFSLNVLEPLGGPLDAFLRAFGEDEAGEIYVLASDEVGPTGTGGKVYRIVADEDGDGVNNLVDNCTLAVNSDQRDTNADGYGNACDPDLDDDGNINFVDLGLMKAVFFSTDPDADLDGDGNVNFLDLAIMKEAFFGSPGPSGIAP